MIDPKEVRILARKYLNSPGSQMLAQTMIGCADEIDRLRDENTRHLAALHTIATALGVETG